MYEKDVQSTSGNSTMRLEIELARLDAANPNSVREVKKQPGDEPLASAEDRVANKLVEARASRPLSEAEKQEASAASP